MKKVILSATALLICAAVNAQLSSDPAAPTVQSAASLSADPLANAVENNQTGEENYQLVRQEGTSSSVYIDQSGGGVTLGNLIYIRQSGDVNGNGALSGQDNRADVRQAGTENEVFVRQEGDGNDAGLVQDASVSQSIGYIRQGTGENAEDNYAGISQANGTNNSAWIQQTYDNSEALTLQDGSNHQALTNQNANPNQSAGHSARVEQNGDGQMSYVAQDGSGSNADVLQNGAGNYSDVQQSGGGASALANNDADVDQDGNGNKSFIAQSGADNSSTVNQLGDLNMSDVTQTGAGENIGNVIQNGNGNYVHQVQNNGTAGSAANQALVNQGQVTGAAPITASLLNNVNLIQPIQTGETLATDGTDDNVAFQSQDGSGNVVESLQFASQEFGGEFAGYTKQIQTGDNNTASVLQNFYTDDGTFDDNNAALQVQTGDNNVAGLIQVGDSHDAWMIQDGDDSAMAVQAGQENDLVTKQWEGANYMQIGQDGIENAIYAAQRGGHSFIASQAGNGNVMEVLQVGPAGDMFETIDCDIPAEMEPMALPPMQNLEIPSIDVPGLCEDC